MSPLLAAKPILVSILCWPNDEIEFLRVRLGGIDDRFIIPYSASMEADNDTLKSMERLSSNKHSIEQCVVNDYDVMFR